MSDYKHKYLKYKSKYLHLKQEGRGVVGFYRDCKNKQIQSLRTDEGHYVSFVIKPLGHFKQKDFTNDTKKPHPNQILKVDTINVFDWFTKKYGGYTKTRKFLYIKWEKVAKDYKGFYLDRENKDLLLRRQSKAMLGKFFVKSWWENEYDFIGVMVFKHNILC